MTSRLRIADHTAPDRIVAQMTDDLVRNRATSSEQDAIRSLFGRYDFDDIAAHAGDALTRAQRVIVRRS